ncbi:heterokaryon incompatibility protein-domain-containing protein [Clohesyomyces aquaticus]|uniref:Heterokaryon incompatibility protein-domain-containing protein n=1 Tax=Clohesyomyces aquaticus TaxID=1231657 RepID=A0A1Y1Y7C9_9PLEO|nr:heterokaryon incompatibility protein-domain-containing protein [Clohesyomyces aquaticus]
MRLINLETLGLEEFFGDNIPDYAILSHTWGPEEVSLQDWALVRSCHLKYPHYATIDSIADAMIDRASCISIEKRSGYEKIVQCCTQAKRDSYRYVWVDTCCIDKTSSAELSEAINSMFYWYKTSAVCYVLLSDVDMSAAHSQPDRDLAIRRSRWFTRGWTLQEFLAPREVIFYDAQWKPIAPKNELAELLSSISGIASKFIDGTESIYNASIAQRMSWASKRRTTRMEDMAYCLLGIFDVHMPLLYGERDKAFLRLQEEIVRRTEDHTYLAWGYQMPLDRDYHGVFARSVAEFGGCGEVIHDDSECLAGHVQITNQGLQMPLSIIIHDNNSNNFVALSCCKHWDKILAFPMDNDQKIKDGVNVWRVPGGPPVPHYRTARTPTIGYLKNSPSPKFWKSQSSQMPIEIRGFNSEQSPSPLSLVEVWPPYLWIPSRAPRPLSVPGQWRGDRILMKVVPSSWPSMKDFLVVVLDIKTLEHNGKNSDFQISRIRPKVVQGDEMKGDSLAMIRGVGYESLNEYTNEGQLCGSLVSVEISEVDCWIVDVKMSAGVTGRHSK